MFSVRDQWGGLERGMDTLPVPALNACTPFHPPTHLPTHPFLLQVIEGMGELHLEIIVDRLRREFKVECEVGAPQVRRGEKGRRENAAARASRS
jgi:hypothetical protein